MKERINRVMQAVGMNASQFAETIGIQRAAMSHIMSGRNNASLDVIMKILEHFKDVSPDWLIFGNGDMWRVGSASDGDISENIPSVSNYSNDEDLTLFGESYSLPSSVSSTKIESGKKSESFDTETNKQMEIPSEPIHNLSEQSSLYKSAPQTTVAALQTGKTIDKIMVFYSDNTFETFSPERKV